MQFSIIIEAQLTDPTPEREHQLLLDCVDQAVAAEAAGFDRVWAVEHHTLRWYAHMSAPEIFLTYVAARTSHIRLGHGVVCLPFNYNHPIRVAERAAMLDTLSGGRLDLGGGRGATLAEMTTMGVDPASAYTQMEEALRIIGSAWRGENGEDFEWHGELVHISPPRSILPRPVQMPHPPLFLACTKKDTVKLAAEYGIGALVLGFAGPDEVRSMREMYDATIEKRDGKRFVSSQINNHLSALCPTIVLDDRDEAVRIGVRGQRFFATALAHWYGGGPPPDDHIDPETDEVEALRSAGEDVVTYLHEAKSPVVPGTSDMFTVGNGYGTADDAIAYAEQLADAGADEIMCLIQMGTVSQDVCLETIRQWGEYVIPHFRAQGR